MHPCIKLNVIQKLHNILFSIKLGFKKKNHISKHKQERGLYTLNLARNNIKSNFFSFL